ncbi:MAG: hypothetical protein HOO91_03860 [Bacteroidales bacterium]|nr:hypothetical protein [Bacteroidales bacterium]
METIYIPIIFGIIGGILNCLLYEKGFILPIKIKDDKITTIKAGCLGNLAMGIGASIIIWGLGAMDFEIYKMIAICTLSGVGGSAFITNMLQKENIELQKEKTDSLHSLINQILAKEQNDKKKKK